MGAWLVVFYEEDTILNRVFAILFIALAALAPAVTLATGLPSLRPELLVLPLAFTAGHFRLVFDDRISRLLCLFLGIAVVALLASYTAFGAPFDGRDLSILPMLVQYWLIYSFGKGLSDPRDRAMLIGVFPLVVATAALVGFAQKYNYGGVNDWLTPLYLEDNENNAFTLNALREELPFGRIVGTVGDPRHFAYLLALGIGAAIASLLNRKRLTVGSIVLVGAMFLCLGSLFLCQSRTGLLAIGVQFCIAVYFYSKRTGNLVVPLAVTSVIAVVAAISWLKFSDEAANERLFMDSDAIMESSGYARVRDFQTPFVKSLENPLILVTGMGPSKALLPGSSHGEIGWVVLRYGLGGLFVYGSILYWTSRRSMVLYRKAQTRNDAVAAMFFVIVMSVWILYCSAESIFKLPSLMSINMLVIGMVFGFKTKGAKRTKRRRASRESTEVPFEQPLHITSVTSLPATKPTL